MSDKRTKTEWVKGKRLEEEGFQTKPSAVRLHGRNETLKHLLVKAAIAREIQRQGRGWDTEVKGPDGRVDVLDLGPPDGKPVVYEVETGVTPKQHRAKVAQYNTDVVRDVLVVDPEDAPDEIPALEEWVGEQVL